MTTIGDTIGDMATVVLPLLLVAVAFLIAARFARRIPTRLGIYRFHMLMYPVVVILGFILWYLMENFHEVDWWVDDATVMLELFFGVLGTLLCLLFVPVVWWIERHPDAPRIWQIGRVAVTTVSLLPYGFILAILLFYRE